MRILSFGAVSLLVACGSDEGVKAFNSDPSASISSHTAGDEVLEGLVTTFRGSVSDPNHGNLELQTTWLAGEQEICPSAPPAEDGTTTCEVTLPAGATDIILEVKDPGSASASASVSITVSNPAPAVDITSHEDGDSLTEGELITLVGVATDANHGSSTLLGTWYTGTEVLCEEAALSETGESSCEFVLTPDDTEITFEVADPSAATGEASVTFEIILTESPEAMIISPEVAGIYYSDQLIVFEGVVSDAEDEAQSLVVLWDSNIDGVLSEVEATPNADGEVMGYGYLTEGEHAIELQVEDTSGKTSTDSVIISVGPPNSAPLCEITAPETASAGALGDLVIFTGTVSDVDVPPTYLAVEWQSDKDGALGTSTPNSSGEASFPFSDLSVNTHVISMLVTDEVGAQCVADVIYTVGTPPVVSITGPTAGETYPQGSSLTFSATVSDNEDQPNDVSLNWDVDGTTFSTQAATSSGVAQFTDDSLGYGVHTLTVTATDSAGLTADDVITFTINGLPSAPAVVLSPDPATTEDDITASASGSVDPEGSAVNYSYEWFQDGVLTSYTSATVAAAATSKGQVWMVRVTPNDGLSDGDFTEASITISNTPPVLDSISISPAVGATNADTLTCSATSIDPDETLYPSYTWSIAGVEIGTGDTIALPTTDANPQDVLTCTASVTDSDGESASDSTTVTLDNQEPTIDAVSIDTAPVYSNSLANCSASFTDLDGENLTIAYEWSVSGVVIGSSPSIQLDNTLVQPNDTLVCTASVSDNYGGTASASDSTTVSNTDPGVSAFALTPAAPTVTDTLSCSLTASDLDGDTPTAVFSWTNTTTGTAINPTNTEPFASTLTLAPALAAPNDVIECAVVVTDAHGGSVSNTASVSMLNTQPVFTVDAAISPDTGVVVGTVLSCAATAEDANDGALSPTYEWTVDGVSLTTGSSYTVAAADIDVGSVIVCTASVVDADGATADSTASVTVENTEPTLSAVVITPSAGVVNSDTLTCSTTVTDPDEALTPSYVWTIGGNPVGSTSSLDLSAVGAMPDDVVTCTASVSDTQGASASDAASVTLDNQAPTIDAVSIDTAPVYSNSLVDCSASFTDLDGESLSVTYAWSVSGVTIGSSASLQLDNTLVQPNDTLICTASVSDNYGSTASASDSTTVSNTDPSISAFALSPAAPVVVNTLSCTLTASDIDGDTPTAAFGWTNTTTGAALNASTTAPFASTLVLNSTMVSPNDVVECSAVVTDAHGGSVTTSATVTLQNTLPVFTTDATITPDTDVRVNTTLLCAAAAEDDDDGTLTPAYTWDVGGVTVATGSSYTVSAADVEVGSEIVCSAVVTDANGGTANSTDSVMVENTPPTLSAVSIIPGSGVVNSDTLSCSATVTDPDESLSPSYTWSLNGNNVGSAASLDLSVAGAMPDDVVTCSMFVMDSHGASANQSAAVTVENRSPSVSAVTITPSSSVTAESSLSCSATLSDDDGESLSATYEWSNGGSVLGADSSLLLTPSTAAPGDTITCTVSTTDAYGATASDSGTVSVGNTAPTISSVSISPNSAVHSQSLLTCSYSASDVDGDTPTPAYAWTNLSTGTTLASVASTLQLDTSIAAPYDEIQCEVTVTDADGDTATDTASVSVENTDPSFDVAANISPSTAVVGTTITCSASASDQDDGSLTPTFAWTDSNGSLLSTSASLLVTASNSIPNADLTCTASVSDNNGGSATSSANITIENTAPVFDVAVSISPSTSIKSNSSLGCSASATDADGDTPTLSYVWTNTTQGTTIGSSSIIALTSTLVQPDDVVTCTVTATDDQGDSVTSSAAVTIENSLPSLSVIIAGSSTTNSSLLTCVATASDIDDATTPSLSYVWSNTTQGTTIGSSAAIQLSSALADGGDTVQCTATATDNYGASVTDSVSGSLDNTAPAIDSIALNPETITAAISGVTCVVSATDADGDTVSIDYEWTVNGTTKSETSDTFTGPFVVGSTIRCRATPSDNLDDGTAYQVSAIVENSAPVVDSISLDPSAVYTNDMLTATAVLSDADAGDAPTASYEWHVIDANSGVDSTVQTGVDNTLNGVNHFDRDDEVYVIVTANDGVEDGAPSTSSSLTVYNTPPREVTISISPDPATAGSDDLVCTVDIIAGDDDADTPVYTYVWTDPNGTVQQTTSQVTATSDTFAAANTSVGTWSCEVTPYDGADNGVTSSATVTVEEETCTTAALIPVLSSNSSAQGSHGIVVSASSENICGSANCSHYESWKAFNGTVNNEHDTWFSGGSFQGQTLPQWLMVDFTNNPVRITELELTTVSGSSYLRAPNTYELQGSNDGLSWTTLLDIDNDSTLSTGPGASVNHPVSLTSVEYRYIRLYVTIVSGHIEVKVGDMQLYGCVPDADEDGYVASEDCDDNDPSIHPYAGDAYGDGVDSDCDGLDCEAASDGSAYFAVCDTSGIGFSTAQSLCQGAGYDGLPMLKSGSEDNTLHSLLGLVHQSNGFGNTWVWLDASKPGNVWTWRDGTTFSYSNFAAIAGNRGPTYIQKGYNSNGEWYDVSSTAYPNITLACEVRF